MEILQHEVDGAIITIGTELPNGKSDEHKIEVKSYDPDKEVIDRLLAPINMFNEVRKNHKKPKNEYIAMNDDDILESEAIKAYRSGEFENAIQLFSLLSKRNPDNIKYILQCAGCHKAIGDLDKAIIFGSAAQTIDKDDYRPYVFLASAQMELGNYQDALSELKVARKKNDRQIPELEELYFQCKGMLKQEKDGQHDNTDKIEKSDYFAPGLTHDEHNKILGDIRSQDEFNRTLNENNPDPIDSDIELEKLANEFYKAKRFADSIDIINELIKRNPEEVRYKLQLAYCRAKYGEVNKALKELNELSEKHTGNPDIHNAKAMIYEEKGDKEKAKRERELEEMKRN